MEKRLAVVTGGKTLIVLFCLANYSLAETTNPPSGNPAARQTSSSNKQQPLFEHSSYPAAWKASQESNRPILVYVSMSRCPHCVKMINNTYRRPEVGELVSDSFETLYADRQTQSQLIKKLSVRWYPTTILVGTNNKILDVIEGYVDAGTFKRRLQMGLAAGTSTQTR